LAMAASTALSPFALSAFSSWTRALIEARSPSRSPLGLLAGRGGALNWVHEKLLISNWWFTAFFCRSILTSQGIPPK